uniref:Armadillo repeat-containing protein 6 n=1 Tax=Graphocephala atropunctata TaxID=36148 RepID=A0A1B6MQ43_9HEMI
MVRVINQQTFDDVVKENMEDFGMAVEEAIEEAVQQFEAQGVNLTNIVKSAAMAEGKDPLVMCVKQLQDVLKLSSSSPLNVAGLLAELKADCEKDLARRVLAGKEGAYPTLLDVLDKFSTDDSTVKLCLQTLASVMNGFPDLLDGRGVKTITSVLNTSKNTEVLQDVLQWARVCCLNHERNRQLIMDADVIPALKAFIVEDVPTLLPEVCGVMRALTLDDDVRADVSKAHTHASSLAVEVLCPLTNLLAKYKSDKTLVLELLLTINSLIVRNEFCAKVEEAGGIVFAIDVLTEYPDNERIVSNSLKLLKGLAGNDDVKQKIMQAGAPSLVMLSLSRHQKSPKVCNAGLSCVTILTLRSQENSKIFMEQGAAEIILQIMKIHPKVLKVQRNCCWAIRNIVSRSPSLRATFLKLGAEELINAARRQHKEIDYDGKSALRDLDCKVDFKEQWKGKGNPVIN